MLVTLQLCNCKVGLFLVVNIGKDEENFVDFANLGCEDGGFLRCS